VRHVPRGRAPGVPAERPPQEVHAGGATTTSAWSR
jgi:hypothetical protein